MGFDRLNSQIEPDLEMIGDFVRNESFMQFCHEIMESYQVKPTFEFSKCSWEMGWNIKFKKGSKTLCTVYPKEHYFTVMVVIGKREKEALIPIFDSFNSITQQTILNTKEGNGQRWIMLDCEDIDSTVEDVKRLIALRVMRK